MKKMASIFARLANQYKFKYQLAFSSRFDKQDEEDQVFEEIVSFIKLTFNQKLTQLELIILMLDLK